MALNAEDRTLQGHGSEFLKRNTEWLLRCHEVHRRFGAINSLHLHERRISEDRKQQETSRPGETQIQISSKMFQTHNNRHIYGFFLVADAQIDK
jgi:hypothetical protein